MTDLGKDNPGIRDLIAEAATIAKEKGWDKTEGTNYAASVAATLMLIVSEASEALEVIREGHEPWEVWYAHPIEGLTTTVPLHTSDNTGDEPKPPKPEGYGVELADICIRVFHEASRRGIDLPKLIVEKMEYNRTRPHRHGGKTL